MTIQMHFGSNHFRLFSWKIYTFVLISLFGGFQQVPTNLAGNNRKNIMPNCDFHDQDIKQLCFVYNHFLLRAWTTLIMNTTK